MTLRDPDIREPLVGYLESLGIVTSHEFTTGGARADVVGITDTDFVVYEIKSDVDTSARLARQVWYYDKVATRLVLVTTPKQVSKMLPLLPPWWGVLIAHETTDGVQFEELRDSRDNLGWQSVLAYKLLNSEEIAALSKQAGVAPREHMPRGVRVKRLIGAGLTRDTWLSVLRNRLSRLRSHQQPWTS